MENIVNVITTQWISYLYLDSPAHTPSSICSHYCYILKVMFKGKHWWFWVHLLYFDLIFLLTSQHCSHVCMLFSGKWEACWLSSHGLESAGSQILEGNTLSLLVWKLKSQNLRCHKFNRLKSSLLSKLTNTCTILRILISYILHQH